MPYPALWHLGFGCANVRAVLLYAGVVGVANWCQYGPFVFPVTLRLSGTSLPSGTVAGLEVWLSPGRSGVRAVA
jgi:hypothetical protein